MVKRIAVIDRLKCRNGTECPFICQGACPINRAGQPCIYENEEDHKARIDENLCIGCMICVKKCPFDAIEVINLPEELKEEPIHRYGENLFQIFSLPTPMFGKVAGVIGKNGIGKSTAIQILAGVLKPNLGRWKENHPATYAELLTYFKGTEAQGFFEKVRDGKIKISYKPQAVDLIPKHTKGTVKELLQKVDEKGMYDEVVNKLDLKEILENDISKISGGELQRVAIAATVLKKANFYVYDEPSSYLDIKQRLKLSTLIKDWTKAEDATMLIEHDMIMMDYLTDLVQIIYGKEGVYGIVSQPKSTKRGINIYLDGYLPDENMRFRSYKIRFEVKAPTIAKNKAALISWTDMDKKLGKFHIKADAGTINKGDIVGVLGENGIGKTSFVKILAGIMQPDSGELQNTVKVSYKPQYLDTESEELVAVFLKDVISRYEIEIVRPLDLKPLMSKQLNQLSGGELQRVSIAAALAKDADLYLLDEPSAYLDVEQRLIISKVIRHLAEERGKTILVVDHDLLFLDYLSSKLMVFLGKPAVEGNASGPYPMETGMNMLLKELDITLRRDEETGRPRINKPDSVKDREQKSAGKYYYQ